MCGIYGLLSTRRPKAALQPDPFFKHLRELLALKSGDPRLMLPEAAKLLERIRQASYCFVSRSGFVAVLRDSSLEKRLRHSLQEIKSWVDPLERQSEQGDFTSQDDREQINRLVIGGRDLAWQIERDVLANLEPVRQLVVEEAGIEPTTAAWRHAWALNLTFNSINRLEVRGRDSAGVAIFAHFGQSENSFTTFVNELRADGLGDEFARRTAEQRADSTNAVIAPIAGSSSLLFLYKVAEEVGEMGDNVSNLRSLIKNDPVFQRALRHPNVDIQILAHTRWASNGIVSVPNCHPVDSAVYRGQKFTAECRGELVAVLNGDIDNYQELYQEYIVEKGLRIEHEITTDAKIIPLVVDHFYRETGNFEEAFRQAFDRFEGSMAIGIMAASRPGTLLFGQKGSGQGLYFGIADDSFCAASEMYGLVELTQSYVKAEGEGVPGGEIFRIEATDDATPISLAGDGTLDPVSDSRTRTAEITTRDINRGSFPRFFLKEITESVASVSKTIRGKYDASDDGTSKFHLGPTVLDPTRLEQLRSGKIRRIFAIGQGTAAIAGDGIAYLLQHSLLGAPFPIQVQSLKATELSGHYLRDDMSDSLVIAISQSGTTTDTNRTVDMAKDRGAWILGIVNRRNSDLVFKSHGVLYTSDGRDVEMSVASTKAFYAQNVAGLVLALALADTVDSLPAEEIRDQLQALDRLPAAMEQTLTLAPQVEAIASQLAGLRRHWAVVGSGFDKIAANEIRIKLSELCYKSIACDFTEDKKHIDLSSEPFILVCAVSTPPTTIADVVKEVSIFKAHQALPVVVTRENENRFDPYAQGVLHVPSYDGVLGYLLTTMVGHLFGYYAASAFDSHAKALRWIQTGLVSELGPVTAEETDVANGEVEFSNEFLTRIRKFQDSLLEGLLDGCLNPASALKLSTVFSSVLGRTPRALEFDTGHVDSLVQSLSGAISELARPIDAIKHQAKTVTVGISRAEVMDEGVLLSTLHDLNVDIVGLSGNQRKLLAAFEPLVANVSGTTVYNVERLDALGRPRKQSTLTAISKIGSAQKLPSRYDAGSPLAGTKWGVVRSKSIYLGCGQTDRRRILIVPLITESPQGQVVLFHLDLSRDATPRQLLNALFANPTLLERIKIAITERDGDWNPQLLTHLPPETLFFESPERIAEEMGTHNET